MHRKTKGHKVKARINFRHGSNVFLKIITDPSGHVKESVGREIKLEKGVYSCLKISETSILEVVDEEMGERVMTGSLYGTIYF